MNIFSTLMAGVFGKSHIEAPSATASPQPTNPVEPAATSPSAIPAAASIPAMTPAPAPSAEPVDVAAKLDEMKANQSEDLDWRKSIVDLMKLVGMESSLSERKELADELGYTGDKSDSAEMNIWLHKQVMKKLAENGGKVPAELLD